jgi:hypothetical protein
MDERKKEEKKKIRMYAYYMYACIWVYLVWEGRKEGR